MNRKMNLVFGSDTFSFAYSTRLLVSFPNLFCSYPPISTSATSRIWNSLRKAPTFYRAKLSYSALMKTVLNIKLPVALFAYFLYGLSARCGTLGIVYFLLGAGLRAVFDVLAPGYDRSKFFAAPLANNNSRSGFLVTHERAIEFILGYIRQKFFAATFAHSCMRGVIGSAFVTTEL